MSNSNILPIFNTSTLEEVKQYMQQPNNDFVWDDDSMETPLEYILELIEVTQ